VRLVLLFAAVSLLACPSTPEPPKSWPWQLVTSGQREAYTSVAGTSAKDVWVVGADMGTGATALHFDGTSWSRKDVGHRATLWWVFPFSETEVFFGGASSTILRYDGSTFTRMPTPGLARHTIFGLWGRAPNDVYAVGSVGGLNGFLWHFDGTAWRTVDDLVGLPTDAKGNTPGLFKVWGPPSGSSVYVVGARGVVLKSDDGRRFERIEVDTRGTLFTVFADDTSVTAVGGAGTGLLIEGALGGALSTLPVPDDVGLLQGIWRSGEAAFAVGQAGAMLERSTTGWRVVDHGLDVRAESLHAAWVDPSGAVWAVGGDVLSGAMTNGVIVRGRAEPLSATVDLAPAPPPPAALPCAFDTPRPGASVARRWNEELLQAIRRDVPSPVVHARNLFHLSAAMWDAWAAYDATATGHLVREKHQTNDVTASRAAAMTAAAHTLLVHRASKAAVGGDVSRRCFEGLPAQLGVSLSGAMESGVDPVSVGARIGRAYVALGQTDGANEQNRYADTTGWTSRNPPLVVDEPGVDVVDPGFFQLLNLSEAITQNGIPVSAGVQGYIGAHWGRVTPFALPRDGGVAAVDAGTPPGFDERMRPWVLDVVRRHAWLDPADETMVDVSPAAIGNNQVGTNDGRGYAQNPATGAPYARQLVRRGDFGRIVAEYWADGPRSETPPGHWNKIANDLTSRPGFERRLFGRGGPLTALDWDVHVYFALNGALHDAAIAAWDIKRRYSASRPITLIRYMAGKGQCSDPAAPAFHPQGLPLEPGIVEVITEASSAPGQRHAHLRRFVGSIAVRTWRGEPGDRRREVAGSGWLRGVEWVPYQRRTFVSPAFPGFISGHSTYSRAGAEVLAALTGSPFFPGGLMEFTASKDLYLTHERGPSTDVKLQWATYFDAADQAGQSRLWGGIHIEPDDFSGRLVGQDVARRALEFSRAHFEGRVP
jgi:hypothetical protein